MYGKFEEVIVRGLGESEAELYYLGLLATNPESQGRGYGSALVAAFVSEVRSHSTVKQTVMSFIDVKFIRLKQTAEARTCFQATY